MYHRPRIGWANIIKGGRFISYKEIVKVKILKVGLGGMSLAQFSSPLAERGFRSLESNMVIAVPTAEPIRSEKINLALNVIGESSVIHLTRICEVSITTNITKNVRNILGILFILIVLRIGISLK